jgi:hypothetical protein
MATLDGLRGFEKWCLPEETREKIQDFRVVVKRARGWSSKTTETIKTYQPIRFDIKVKLHQFITLPAQHLASLHRLHVQIGMHQSLILGRLEQYYRTVVRLRKRMSSNDSIFQKHKPAPMMSNTSLREVLLIRRLQLFRQGLE